MNKNIQRGLILVGSLVGATGAMAQAVGPDLTSLTGAISFGTVTAAVLSIAAGLALVYLAMKGASILLGMLRGR